MSPFDDERLFGARSALVRTTPDELGRFEFELWIQYTRAGLNAVQVGDLVGIENYSQNVGAARSYSVLTLTQVYPIHFANQGADAYPGHLFESMRSIKEDWETQSEKPLHPTTTIRATAVSTGWQFAFDPRASDLPTLEEETGLPMTGGDVRPLSMTMVDAIINLGMQNQPPSPFTHKKFEEINVRLDVQALLTTHFGIFGFTGVGKSNLVSSLVEYLGRPDPTPRANVVVVDPNDEYLGLLIDLFQGGREPPIYIHVGTDSLPVGVLPHIGVGAPPPPEPVLDLMVHQMKLPARLRGTGTRIFLRQSVARALPHTRLALPAENLPSLIGGTVRSEIPEKAGQPVRHAINDILDAWTAATAGRTITSQTIDEAVVSLNDPQGGIRATTATLQAVMQSASGPTAQGILDRAVSNLQRVANNLRGIPQRAVIPMSDLLGALNNAAQPRLVILTGRRDSELKSFVEVLGNRLYEERRVRGVTEPTTLFVFDEADLFIPQVVKDEETERVKELCVTLARRGRKYNLGIAIATQRAALLDTEVMGNLHTYFVSKLPRKGDRERVAEAFGIDEEQLSPTFTFRPGSWLAISHDATGLKGVPIPTKAANADDRILAGAGTVAR